MLHFVLWLVYLIDSSKVIKVGGKQNPYEMWQAGISLAAAPLAKSLAASPARNMAAPPPLARSRIPPATQAKNHPALLAWIAAFLTNRMKAVRIGGTSFVLCQRRSAPRDQIGCDPLYGNGLNPRIRCPSLAVRSRLPFPMPSSEFKKGYSTSRIIQLGE